MVRFRSSSDDYPSAASLAEGFIDCNDCGQDVDPNDAAPSCGAHVLCVPCWTTGKFSCRECFRVWADIALDETADARARRIARAG